MFQDVDDSGWWKGELNGAVGVFPDNFVELLPEEVIPLTVLQNTFTCVNVQTAALKIHVP